MRLEQLEDRITPTGPTLVTLAAFQGTNCGLQPMAGVIMDSSGNLYGTTLSGGAYGDGAIFELAKGSSTIKTLASFNGSNGKNPYDALLMDSSGNLYGTTDEGGAYGPSYGDGTVFELAKGSSTITTLASFNGTDGAFPEADLIMDSSGNLYGVTGNGGASGDGTVFEVTKGSNAITTLVSFNSSNGAGPGGGLIMDSSGNLYGTTSFGGTYNDGIVFELAKGSTITTLATFNGSNGANPGRTNLIMDSSGDLYGVTGNGGSGGTVFELAKGSSTITTLASFDGTDGTLPNAGVIMDGSGNLFGTTSSGATNGNGTVFEVAKGSGTITTLYSFTGYADGGSPFGGLIADSNGNLYGTTRDGGDGGGTVFEVQGAIAVTNTDQWTGAGSDSNWSDGANWSTGAPPTSGQTAIFTDDSSVKSFTSTIDSGFTNAIAGLDIDGTWGNGGGTVTVNSPLTVSGNFTMASGTFGGSGAVTITGTKSQWTGGTIDLGSGGFTNSGTLTYSGSNNVTLDGSGSFINKKSFLQTSGGTLSLNNGAIWNNARGSTYNIESNGGISESGGGSIINAGMLEKTKGTGTSTIASSTLNNTGTVKVSSGTLDIAATVSQVSGSTLTAGTWSVNGSAKVSSTLDITSAGSLDAIGSAAHVTLSGLNTTFSNLSGLSSIAKGGSFTLAGGQSFTTTGDLTNNGRLTISPNSVLTVGGGFTQSSSGTLAIQLGGTSGAPTFGQLVSTTGSVAVAGKLSVTSTVVPAVGSSFAVLDNEDNAAIGGTFANLPEGATFNVKKGTTTMTFQVSYMGTDDDGSNNIVITRSA